MCLAIPGVIVEIDSRDPLAPVGRIDFGGVSRTVSLAFVPEARAGDFVLIHDGFALSVHDVNEAHVSLNALHELDGQA